VSDPFAIATALVRGWTWAYTCTLDPAVRHRRRAEIDADLWSAAHDATRERSAAALLWRAAGGVLDDIAWTFEQPQHLASIASAWVALGTLAIAAWLLATTWMRVGPMPQPQVAPAFAGGPLAGRAAPPPPPPPPPPCLPAGMAGSPVPCAR
jgi:hypothetical protein